MVAYSFRQQFVEPILTGAKCQTVRAIGSRRHAKPGDELQLYAGMRTKSCRLIACAKCKAVQPVQIVFAYRDSDERDMVFLDGVSVPLHSFAEADGFACWRDLQEFWRKHHPNMQTFNGLCISWMLTPAWAHQSLCSEKLAEGEK